MKAYDKLYDLETKEKAKRIKVDELTKELEEMDSNIQEVKAWIPLNNLIQRQTNLKLKIISLDSISIERKQDYDVHLRKMHKEIEILDAEIKSVEKEILILKTKIHSFVGKRKTIITLRAGNVSVDTMGQSLDF